MTLRLVRSTTIATVTALALLAGCGGNDDAGQPAAGAGFNAADVSFAQGMIPHHLQAVKMASLAASRAKDPAVKMLAAQIVAAQGPEIETLQAFLQEWGQPLGPDVEGEDHSSMPSHEMADSMSGQMSGMASEDELAQLEAAKGAAFDRLFLSLMLAHHEGAVEMARTEQADGADPEAKELAAKIQTDQRAEIERMQELRGN